MRTYTGRVIELRLDANRLIEARIACPAGAVPAPGQYVQALDAHNPDDALAWTIFPGEIAPGSFVAAAPIPSGWTPGMELRLRGPLGKGFHLPLGTHRIALAGLGKSVTRLLPLAAAALAADVSAALFFDAPLPALPSSLEIYPLASLPDALTWADFIALDLPLQKLGDLRVYLRLTRDQNLVCPAQALIMTSMPCAATAECGTCGVPTHRGWKLACQDGPVFDLRDIEW
jgi:hypothetical protein